MNEHEVEVDEDRVLELWVAKVLADSLTALLAALRTRADRHFRHCSTRRKVDVKRVRRVRK